jgi:glycosyltransferase involved in cell wall biosynthesis
LNILNKNKILTSIIITTFNREKNLIELINLINKQVGVVKNTIEIIICDSNSKKKISVINYIKQFRGLRIVYYNCKINHQAFKRNYGIKNSIGKYKIFIDDDCFPENNFSYQYLKILHLNRKKIIYFGLVSYVKFSENKNLIKYRQSRVYCLPNQQSVPYKNFLTMNMGYNSETICKNDTFFDDKFRNYGFEDFEFAYRFKEKSYKLIQLKSLVHHRDNRNFDDFLKKYNFLGRYGIEDIIKINLMAAKDLIYYKIEKNLIVQIFLKVPRVVYILNLIEKIIRIIEKKIPFYFSILYDVGITAAYLKGAVLRNYYLKQTNQKRNEWYK